MATPERRKSRIAKWSAIVIGVMALVAVAGVFIVPYFAKRELVSELNALGIGEAHIKSVNVTLGGIRARGITFDSDVETSEPWLVIEELDVNHSFFGLVAGVTTFDEIEIRDIAVVLDTDHLEPEDNAEFDFELKEFSLPAKKINISDVLVRVRQQGRTDFVAEFQRASATQSTDQIEFQAELDDFLKGKWTTSGVLQRGTRQYSINAKSDRFQIDDRQWQQWPFVPERIEELLDANIVAEFSGQISSTGAPDPNYHAEITLKPSSINLKQLDLDLKVDDARLVIADGDVELNDGRFSVDDSSFALNANTSFKQWPIATNFKGNFQNLNLEMTSGRLPELSADLSGTANGTVEGQLTVNNDYSTELAATLSAESDDGNFGKVVTNNLATIVKLNSLVTDSEGSVQTLNGMVQIDAKLQEQPLSEIFKSLDLASLDDQLNFKTLATGDLEFQIPLATGDDFNTWVIKFNATSPTGLLSGQALKDISASGQIVDGLLSIPDITAQPVSQLQTVATGIPQQPITKHRDKTDPELIVTVQWPLTEQAVDPETGKIVIRAGRVHADWVAGYVRNRFQPDFEPIDLYGNVNLNCNLNMPTASPEDMKGWHLEGRVFDSSLGTLEHQLTNLSAQLRLRNKILTLNQLEGDFEQGGVVRGTAEIDVDTNRLEACQLKATQVPMPWLVQTARSFNADVDQVITSLGVDADNLETNIQGVLAIDVSLAQGAVGGDADWKLNANLESERIVFKGQDFEQINVQSVISNDIVDVQSASASFLDGGFLQLQGKWNLDSQLGTGDLQWQTLPYEWIEKWIELDSGVTGNTFGKVQFTANNAGEETDQAFPVSVNGVVGFEKLNFEQVSTKPFLISLNTRENKLLIDDLRFQDVDTPLDLKAEIELTEPYTFALTANVTEMQLAQWLKSNQVIEYPDLTIDGIEGVASAEFAASGTLEPLNLNTKGNAAIVNAVIQKKNIGDLAATWNYTSDNSEPAQLLINGLGGSLQLEQFDSEKELLSFTLTNIDLEKVQETLIGETRILGIVSGKADIANWSDAEKTTVDISLNADTADVSSISVENLASKFTVRNQLASYSVNGELLGGSISGSGETTFSLDSLTESSYPANISVSNLSLERLGEVSTRFKDLKALGGTISSTADVVLSFDEMIEGSGRAQVSNLRWDNNRIARRFDVRFQMDEQAISLEEIRGNLYEGSITGRARYDLTNPAASTYEFNIRNYEASRLAELFTSDELPLKASIDARLGGRFGGELTGQGMIAVNRIQFGEVSGQSVKLPIQYRIDTTRGTGKIELRRSKVRLFDGTATGKAVIEFGRYVNFETDLELAKINTEKLFDALVQKKGTDQGKLNGRLVLSGRQVSSLRDIKGSFKGNLERSKVFQLPILSNVATVLSGNQIPNREFDSEQFELKMDKGRIAIKNLNFSNSVAQVAIGGNIYVDGRLDLNVVARTEQFNQPTLIEELTGSPLINFSGTPAAFFAQASEFLSNRLVFLTITGSVRRPQVRPDTSRQIGEEAIRYFLKDTNFSEILNRRNN